MVALLVVVVGAVVVRVEVLVVVIVAESPQLASVNKNFAVNHAQCQKNLRCESRPVCVSVLGGSSVKLATYMTD